MTRNEFIAQSTILLCAHQNSPAAYAVDFAKGMAATLEARGCAPWQDAPPAEYHRSKLPASGQMIQSDLPTRREITAATVTPPAQSPNH